MLVSKRMSRDPVTITPNDSLATAQAEMEKGGFRHLPVVQEGRLVGIITDRDMRQHVGFFERTKVNAVMTEESVTVTPMTTLEQAAGLLLRRRIGGLPVVEKEKLVGIITTTDILRAFLDVMGASQESTSRIDLLLEGGERDFATASKTIAEEGGEILGVGTYREKWDETPVCYIRLRAPDVDRLADVLKEKGYPVLGVHV